MSDVPITDIAITGLSCRFPGARSVSAYRDMLSHGKSAFRHLSLDEIIAAGVPSSIVADPQYVKVGAPLERIDEFDIELFRLAPDEAAMMDPQHYHFMECTYEALQTACCPPEKKEWRVGVFAGADLSYFALRRLPDNALWDPVGCWRVLLGNDSHFLTTSISHRLGLRGPSIGIQTACSTSLVAVHLAIQALIAGDCDVAVAGGVSIRGPQTRGYLYRDGGILSPSGICRPFDKDADGTILSSGVGVVVLMRMADALSGQVPIWAVIKGSAVNNDGSQKVAYTAPSVDGQAAVISEAISVARIDPSTIGYVETHGTGTKLGDPMEHRALTMAFKAASCSRQLCYIGSVKSNFGHLESAAGVAGLIKAILSVRYGEIYPSLGFLSPNPEIDFASSPFEVANRRADFPTFHKLRRAAVSSFGIGGTNCHVVIEETPLSSNALNCHPAPEPQTYFFQRKRVWSPPAITPSIPPLPASVSLDTREPHTVLADLWRQVTGRVPNPSDQFIEIGGDSLMATQLAVKIKNTLGADVPITDILSSSSFSDLAKTVVLSKQRDTAMKYPLSPGQRSVWIAQTVNPEFPAYTVQAVFRLHGTVNVEALRQALSDLVQRQDVLRTRFCEVDGQVYQQVVTDCDPVQWELEDGTWDETSAMDRLTEHGETVIDLTNPPLLSVLVIRTIENVCLISVVSHHIVSDEWSAKIMLRDMLEFYTARVTGRKPVLPALPTSFGDHARNQQQWLTSELAQSRVEYWRSRLQGCQDIDLPYDRPRSERRAYRGAVMPFNLIPEIYESVRSLAQEHKATPFMVLTTVLKILLVRYTRQSDICIGTNIAGRENAEVQDVVGLFTNTVPLRTDLSGNPTFAEALKRVRNTALEAYDHQLPFSTVVDALNPPRVASRNPFFDILIAFQNVPRPKATVPGLSVEPVPVHNGTCKFDIELTLEESDDGRLVGRWEYDSELFDSSTIKNLSQQYNRLIESVTSRPEAHISRLSLISDTERRILLEEWNQTDLDFGFGKSSLWDIFTRQAVQNSSSPAIIASDGSLITYQDLLYRSQALATRLHANGVVAGDLVGVFCHRSEWYVQALLGIQACGGAFLPLDISLPDSRLSDMIEAAHVRQIVTSEQYLDRLSVRIEPEVGETLTKTVINQLGDTSCSQEMCTRPMDLAYVIYTSGSTGKPKGAMVNQAGMLNHLYAKIHTLAMNISTRLAFTAPICFDISTWQCLAPLLVGGAVVVISDEQVMDIQALLERLETDRVDIVELVPSYLDVVLEHLEHRRRILPHLRYMVATGEKLPAETCRRWLALFPEIPIVNAYGPTECSDDVLQHVIKASPSPNTQIVPIGHPLPNTKIFILDDECEPVPVGAVGEIYVGGICVGPGYINDPKLTSEAFIPDPFSSKTGDCLYKTGDLGRWRHDGTIEYLGRLDSQVKVRGVRIEVEEVEAVLRNCSGISDVAVTPDIDGKTLIAFVTQPPNEIGIDLQSLREYTKAQLPMSMLPSSFLVTDEIPKTASGKVNRTALQKMVSSTGRTNVRLQTQVESAVQSDHRRMLHQIWCQVLGRQSLPTDADFFDIGGDSLKAIRVAALAQKQGCNIVPADIFAYPTLQALSDFCKGLLVSCVSTSHPKTIQQLNRGEQWFLAQEFPDARLCDSAFLVTLASGIKANTVEDIVASLWERHEGLRARFWHEDEVGWQKTILPSSVPVPFSILDISGSPPELIRQTITTERSRTPGKDGPLFRAILFTKCDELWLLVVTHYLICDFVSWQILLDDFEMAFLGDRRPLAPKEPRAGELTTLLPFKSDEFKLGLSVQETDRLMVFARNNNFPIETILTAVVACSITHVQKKRIVSVAIGRHGRNLSFGESDTSRIVRRFAHPVMVKVEVTKEATFRQVLPRIQNLLLDSFECGGHQPEYTHVGQSTVAIDYLGDSPIWQKHNSAIHSVTAVSRRHSSLIVTPYDVELVAEIRDKMLLLTFRCAPSWPMSIANESIQMLKTLAGRT